MTTVVRCKPRARTIEAMRILIGITSRSDILAFCPHANVGVSDKSERDIRWVFVDGAEGSEELTRDGDWLVKLDEYRYTIVHDREFNEGWVMV